MGKNRKYEKNILKLYSKYSDDEIYNMVLESLTKYSKLINSEQVAKEILMSYNLHFYLNSGNERFKHEHQKLILCAKLRGIVIHDIIDEEITADDVIERIRENRYKEMSLIDEYCYVYDGYSGNGNWYKEDVINEENYFGADIVSNEVYILYERIIDKVKELYKQEDKVFVKK